MHAVQPPQQRDMVEQPCCAQMVRSRIRKPRTAPAERRNCSQLNRPQPCSGGGESGANCGGRDQQPHQQRIDRQNADVARPAPEAADGKLAARRQAPPKPRERRTRKQKCRGGRRFRWPSAKEEQILSARFCPPVAGDRLEARLLRVAQRAVELLVGRADVARGVTQRAEPLLDGFEPLGRRARRAGGARAGDKLGKTERGLAQLLQGGALRLGRLHDALDLRLRPIRHRRGAACVRVGPRISRVAVRADAFQRLLRWSLSWS